MTALRALIFASIDFFENNARIWESGLIAKKKRPMPHHREDAHRGASSPSIIEKPVSWRLGYSTPPEKVTPPGKTAMMGQFEMAPMALMPPNPAFGVPGNAPD